MTTPLVPELGPNVPRRRSRIGYAVGLVSLRLLGWRVVGRVADIPRAICAVAPHTSNWDFVVGLAVALAMRLHSHFLAKHSLFWPPLGPFLRVNGGIPVERRSAEGLALEIAQRIRQADRFFLTITPEGTRSRVERWKSGFHRIARAAGVPVIPVVIDWRTREVRFLEPFSPTDDITADLAALRALFDPAMARHPENFA